MTNAEKFEEVFGFKPNSNLCYAPGDVECPPDCDDCQYISWLNDEYVAEPKQGECMAKESMIKVLRYKAEHIKTKIKPEFFAKVADMLEQEPCEKAVSLQAVNKLFDSEIKRYEKRIETRKGSNYHDETERIREFGCRIANAEYWQDKIKELPPVQPKPKMGHWIEYTRVLIPEPFNKWEQAWYCSECGYGNQECEDGSAWLEWKCCPRCGARMLEPQERSNKK